MNIVSLQEELIKTPEHIKTVLEKLGHTKITDRGSYFQCCNIDGDNPTACCVRKDNLVWSNFSHSLSGSIWSMVQEEAGVSFKESLNLVAKWIDFEDDPYIAPIVPFGGFYKSLLRDESEEIIDVPTYDIKTLPSPKSIPAKWIKDGVSAQVLEDWGVRYCHDTDEIIIPWTNIYGDLIGAKARSNDPDCEFGKRWNMYLKFQTSQSCYGLSKNYEFIKSKNTIILFEAEKSTLIAASWNMRSCVSIGGHNISKVQQKYIKALMCKRIIIAFDEGICEDEIKYTCSKLKIDTGILKNKVGYIWDETGKILIPGSKDSPADVGFTEFKELLQHHVRWV